MAKVQNADGLGPSQVLILNILAKASTGMTAAEISHAGKGLPVNVNTIGPVYAEHLENYPGSLRARGLVRAQQYEGDDVLWHITEKGKKLGDTMKGRRIGASKKVPNDILDPALRAFKKTRAYGLEVYTDDDIIAFRKTLPAEYHDVGIDDLRRQNEARRKQGAFADPEEKRVKSLQKLLREFGPNGTVIKEFLTEDQVAELYNQLGNNAGEDE